MDSSIQAVRRIIRGRTPSPKMSPRERCLQRCVPIPRIHHPSECTLDENPIVLRCLGRKYRDQSNHHFCLGGMSFWPRHYNIYAAYSSRYLILTPWRPRATFILLTSSFGCSRAIQQLLIITHVMEEIHRTHPIDRLLHSTKCSRCHYWHQWLTRRNPKEYFETAINKLGTIQVTANKITTWYAP